MSTRIICRRCKEPINEPTVHRVRIVLVNAHESALLAQVDKEDDFHHRCAADIFKEFDGGASRG